MTLSPQSLWRASLLLFLGQSIIHSGEATVFTEVQSGPLYRVRNYPLSISCNVTGFSDLDAIQDFEFSIYKSDLPSHVGPLRIISTKDPSYSYAVYSPRVNNRDISVERVSPTSVLFKINNIAESDEGDFECNVVNSESAWAGTYAGRTTVNVIDNSLAVSTPDTTSLSHKVGEAITLTCQASCYTIQHTHLSVTWSLLRDGERHARPIISLDKDFTLSPGQGFEERYESGLIGLEKVGEATYKLKMSQLEPSDQGNIYCEAREWIQDPDRSWYAIAKEVTGAIALKVEPKEVAPSNGTLTVRITVPPTTLLEGQEMSLSCNLDTQNLQERFFSVAWLQNGTELARIGPTGVLSVGPEYSGRDSGGELRVIRIGDTDQRLILRPVRTQDQGEYRCRAWPQDRGTDGTFMQGAAQDSAAQLVTISATASALSVEMQTASVTVQEGDRLQLTCEVKGAKGRLSIAWQHRSAPIKSTGDVISINQEGVMELGSGFAQRSLKATRPTPDTFTLELNEVTPADGGVYLCTVSEWSIETDGTLQKTLSQTESSDVSVSPAEALLEVHLSSRDTIVTVGEQTRLLCRVRGPRLPVTVTWSLQRKGTSSPDNILTLSRDGDITWHGDQVRYQLETEISTTNPKPEVKHTLLLIGASHREAGTYQCDVSVFMRGIHRKLRSSNRLAVRVNDPVSKLSLRASNPVVKGNVDKDLEIKCHIAERTSDSSRFAVTWWVQHHTGSNRTILSSDRDAVLTFRLQAESGTWQRFGMKRSEGQSIDLTVRQARVGDSGTYHCVVVEWLQDPRGEWYELSPAHGAIDVQIVEPANDLRVDKTEMHLMAREAEEVDLNCNLTSGAANPSSRFTLTWSYVAPGAPDGTKVLLVELDHSGLLTYPKNQELQSLQERLRLSRPAHTSFHLGIQGADESDSGTYRCGVEQYQLNQGVWQLKAKDHSGPITLSVKPTEGNLSMLKKDVELNVTASQKFNVSCDITSRSSQSSAFQVTWFWEKETGSEKLPIYTSYRDATLQDRSDERGRLRFDHPAPDRFELTILGSVAADSGLYLCEVEEWLLSSSHGWRRVAVETSGEVTVTVYADGVVAAGSGFPLGMILGVLTFVIVCLLVVVVLLTLKICRGQVSGAKQSHSLWAEGHPLKTQPEPEEPPEL